MTPEQQRIAIAEACGWTQIHENPGMVDPYIDLLGKHPTIKMSKVLGNYQWLPDYPNDLNAMHEAEKVLDFKQSLKYVEMLGELVEESPDFYAGWGIDSIFKLVHATSQQRAEAFLRTINKWKD